MASGSLDFTAAFWLFPLLAAPGLWLAARLYLKSTPRRPVLAAMSAVAWLLLALLAVAPLWRSRAETWHPPLVVLAVDESPSYAALGARDSAVRAMGLARAHYEALGFRVVELGFAERVIPGGAHRRGKVGSDAGTLTFLSSLRRHVNAEAGGETATGLPNLQAVLLWSDGRFADGDVPGPWPARLFPVAGLVYTGEVQGENAEVDFAAPGGALLTVEWRVLGTGSAARSATSATLATSASIEILAGKNLLWKTETAFPSSADKRARAVARFSLPAPLSGASADPSAWILRVRPAGGARNTLAENDTVPLRVRGRDRPRHLFLRPLASLEERGLMDALRAPEEEPDAFAVAAVTPDSLRVLWRDVVWIRVTASARLSKAARGRILGVGAPLIAYHLPATAANGSRGGVFASEARLAWRADGAEFLPAGAVRLADLGAETLWLRAPDSSVEALAWAEQDGHRGLLFWQERGGEGPTRFGFAAPPLWSTGFAAGNRMNGGEGAGSGGLAVRWARGAAQWASLLAQGGGLRVSVPDPLFADRPFAIAARGAKDGEGVELNIRGGGGRPVHAITTGSGTLRFEVPGLSAGKYPCRIRRGSAEAASVLWSGVLHVADARAVELARLGTDAEALDPLAARSAGNVIYFHGNDLSSNIWPMLPGGQARSSRARILALAPPFATALLVIALLSAVWALRKRLRLD